MSRPIPALLNPSLQLSAIPGLQEDLKRLRLRDHAGRDRVALDRVELRSHMGHGGGLDAEGEDQPSEDGVQLAVGEMVADAAARAGAVSEVLRARPLVRSPHEAVRDKIHGRLEVCGIMIGGPHILLFCRLWSVT